MKKITKKIRDNFIFDKFNYYDKNNVIFQLGKYHGILDKKGNITWFIETEDLRSIGRGKFIIKVDDKYGIINKDKKYIIEPEYEHLERIFPDKAISKTVFIASKNGKYGIINIKNKIIIDFMYDGLQDLCGKFRAEINGKKGIINLKNNILIPFEYEDITIVSYFFPNLFEVGKNGKRGIINQKNKVIIPIKYDYIGDLGNKTLCADNNVIDYKNKIINSDFSHIETLCLLSANEEPLFPALKNGKMGFIDQYGNIKIDFEYEDCEWFFEGYAEVSKDGINYGLINSKGELVLPYEYDDRYFLKHPDDEWFIISKNNKYGVVDKNNNKIIEFLFDELDYSYGNDLLEAKIGDKWGIIDLKGNPLTIKRPGLKKFADNMSNVEQMKLIFDCQEI